MKLNVSKRKLFNSSSISALPYPVPPQRTPRWRIFFLRPGRHRFADSSR